MSESESELSEESVDSMNLEQALEHEIERDKQFTLALGKKKIKPGSKDHKNPLLLIIGQGNKKIKVDYSSLSSIDSFSESDLR